jgi:hypothetical protein
LHSVHAAVKEVALKNLLVATTTAFTLSLTASYAIVAQEQETPKSKFLGNFAGAMVVSFKCKSWNQHPRGGVVDGVSAYYNEGY